jgi:hypothetical protein
MAGAALVVEAIFAVLGLIPAQRNAGIVEASLTWNYTTWLNIAFLVLAGLLVWKFLKTGGPEMLRMMNQPARNHTRSLAATESKRWIGYCLNTGSRWASTKNESFRA